ncbi:MAG: PAS domain S-box protein, partial [Telluria sp.]
LLIATGDSFLTAGMSYVRFESADGALLGESGARLGASPAATLALRNVGAGERAALLWQDGFVLRAVNDVISKGKLIGRVHTEERMPTFQKLIVDIQKSGDSSDVLICGRENDAAVCAPSRFYATSQRIPMYRADGQPNFPINRALLGQTGTTRTRDLRKIPVLAAYTPVGAFGLGMVVKIDEEAVYAPMRRRFAGLGAIVLAIIAAGAIAVRMQVEPVLSRLVREQTRNRVILANSNDAFIALDHEGKICDWNAQAEVLFGWSKTEALGRDLAALIIPPVHRSAHHAGLARFAATGAGPVINKTIEVTALRRDGTEFPVELSVTGYQDGARYVSNAFVRDITRRKAAEQELADKERFLRTVTDNLPALIAYADAGETFVFANARPTTVLGVAPGAM